MNAEEIIENCFEQIQYIAQNLMEEVVGNAARGDLEEIISLTEQGIESLGEIDG